MKSKSMPIRGWSVDPDNGLVQSLHTEEGVFPIITAGCEIGNWLGFFSQKNMSGIACTIKHSDISVNEFSVNSRFEIALPRARIELQCDDSLEGGYWVRRYTATALEPSWLGDFVVRLGMPASFWPLAGSGCRLNRHRSWNTYHQYPVREVVLDAPLYRLETEITDTEDRGRLATVSYWRDEPEGNWIIHHRLLVSKDDLDYVVGRFRRATYNSSDTSWLKSPFFWRPLWAINENWVSRLPIRFVPTFQTQGVIVLPENEKIVLSTKLRLLTTVNS